MNTYNVGGVIKSDVLLRFTKTNKPVLNLLVQTTEKFKINNEQRVKRNMHSVKLWGKPAELVAKNYSKGDFIVVMGISETKPHGDGYVTELIVTSIEDIRNTHQQEDE